MGETKNCARVCTRDRLRDEIFARILDGRYPPDMHLKEMALAKEFGTSQAPVREALRDLEALGLVENERYRGTRVRSTSAVELKEAYELRALIEDRSAQKAVPCSPGDLDTLSQKVELMHRSARSKDPEGYSQAALVFHRRIVEISGNKQFLKAFDSMQWGVRSRIAIYSVLDDLPQHAADHADVLKWLKLGDGVQAGAMLKAMLERFIDVLDKMDHL